MINAPGKPRREQTQWFVFVAAYRPTLLLRHFIQHYAQIGFTDIVLAVPNATAFLPIDTPSTVTLHLRHLYEGVFDNSRDAGVLNGLRAQFVSDKDMWSATADLDEFFEFSLSLAEIARTVEDSANTIEGHFVDCVAANGSLADIVADKPMNEQFPERCRITKKLVRGNDRKVMLSRGFEMLLRGHHNRDNRCPSKITGTVLHYKWSSSVTEHLRDRIEDRDRTGYRWLDESERVLNHIQTYGRLMFEDYR